MTLSVPLTWMPDAVLRLALLVALLRLTTHWSVTEIPSFPFFCAEQSRTVLFLPAANPPPPLESALELAIWALFPAKAPIKPFAVSEQSITAAPSPSLRPCWAFQLTFARVTDAMLAELIPCPFFAFAVQPI